MITMMGLDAPSMNRRSSCDCLRGGWQELAEALKTMLTKHDEEKQSLREANSKALSDKQMESGKKFQIFIQAR